MATFKRFLNWKTISRGARFLTLATLVSLAVCAPTAEAQLVIDPVYDSTITGDPNAATIENTIQTSIDNLEADIANPVTVQIDFTERRSHRQGK